MLQNSRIVESPFEREDQSILEEIHDNVIDETENMDVQEKVEDKKVENTKEIEATIPNVNSITTIISEVDYTNDFVKFFIKQKEIIKKRKELKQ